MEVTVVIVAMETTVMGAMVAIMIILMDLATMAGKGTAGGRANTGGSRRGTNRTDWREQGHNYTTNWDNGDTY